jgi:hypothetical protein
MTLSSRKRPTNFLASYALPGGSSIDVPVQRVPTPGTKDATPSKFLQL